MENNKLAGMNEVFNNQTLTYRINGFQDACSMNDITIKKSRTSLFHKRDNNEEDTTPDYCISLFVEDIDDDLEGIRISGYYDDLNFVFNNFHVKSDDLDSEIINLPYDISLYKTIRKGDKTFEDTLTYVHNSDGLEYKIDNWVYHLIIKDDDEVTDFTIKKYREGKSSTIVSSKSFYTDSIDFGIVLKVIKSFSYNPELFYTTISEIINNKLIRFNNFELDRVLMEDKGLDQFVKVKK
jgi:hypothetical protein